MPPVATAIPINTGCHCHFSILNLALPGNPMTPIGVFLLDISTGDLHLKLRDDWDTVGADEDDQEYLASLAEDFVLQIREMGATPFLQSLEDSLSGILRISDREPVIVVEPSRTLLRLFDAHVDRTVRKFVTHLPLYSLHAAATRFGEDAAVELTDWVRAPEGLRLTEGMFVGQVVGRSMEPLIPDGSYCIFRAPVAGSRQGRLLLIQEIRSAGSMSAFTIKRYTSKKSRHPEYEWQNETIRLEPLNPEFEAFELDPDEFVARYRVIAEFVDVLPEL